jgi:hypothetical protein
MKDFSLNIVLSNRRAELELREERKGYCATLAKLYVVKQGLGMSMPSNIQHIIHFYTPIIEQSSGLHIAQGRPFQVMDQILVKASKVNK